jgi:hypothetical protein
VRVRIARPCQMAAAVSLSQSEQLSSSYICPPRGGDYLHGPRRTNYKCLRAYHCVRVDNNPYGKRGIERNLAVKYLTCRSKNFNVENALALVGVSIAVVSRVTITVVIKCVLNGSGHALDVDIKLRVPTPVAFFG